MKKIIVLILGIMLAGCATISPEPPPRDFRKKPVTFGYDPSLWKVYGGDSFDETKQ